MQQGPAKDVAVTELVDVIKKSDPSSSFHWAITTGDEKSRKYNVRTTIIQWRKTDPQAAKEAVNAANFSKEERAHYMKFLR